MAVAFSLTFASSLHPTSQRLARIKLAFDLVQPGIDGFLLGHDPHEQPVVVDERAEDGAAHRKYQSADCHPIANRQLHHVVLLSGHAQLLTGLVG